KLLKLGPDICPELKACIVLTQDAEIQVRLLSLIHKLHGDPATVTPRIVFDRFVAQADYWGYLEDSPIVVMVNGKPHPLNRKYVARVSVKLPGNQVGLKRVIQKEFPLDCVEEAFETNPVNGQPLKAGDNVEKMFVPKGFLLSTSVKNSFV